MPLLLMADLLAHIPDAGTLVSLASVPDPGSGEAPPGAEGFLAILGWVKWIALGVCVAGLMAAGATMAIQSRRGEGGEHMGRIVMIFAGVIVIAAATSLIGFLVDTGGSSATKGRGGGTAAGSSITQEVL